MSVSYDFTGKVALITGSSSGIGSAIALLFSKSGANVVVTGRNADRVAEVAKRCTDQSPKQLKALQVVADITKEEECDQLIEKTVQTFGKIDILVNNAGDIRFCEVTDNEFMPKFLSAIKLMLYSSVYMTHKCVDYLAKTRGTIINISSIESKQSIVGVSSDCVSKAGVDMFTKCMAAELGPKRIRVNAIISGTVMPDESLKVLPNEEKEIYELFGQKYPVGRAGQGIDIANTVAYLASDGAEFITGSIVVVDGGHLAANVMV